MSIEEIIKSFETYIGCMEKDCDLKCKNCCLCISDEALFAAIREAIALLRTHPDNQPNEPLTLEELREMDGQPVWCQPDEGVGCWVLVTVRASKMVVRDQYGMTGDVEVWMKRGERYYRRPPKEE